MKAQALRNNQMDQFMGARKILEVNPNHIIIKTLREKFADETNMKQCSNIVYLMYDNAVLNSGFVLENPSEYANKVNKMIEVGFCGEDDDDENEEVPNLSEHVKSEHVKSENLESESVMEEVD